MDLVKMKVLTDFKCNTHGPKGNPAHAANKTIHYTISSIHTGCLLSVHIYSKRLNCMEMVCSLFLHFLFQAINMSAIPDSKEPKVISNLC